jgi:DNA-binding transcriptional regulator YhcF (GntR family)
MTSRPALIVDTGDPTPPYEQLRRQLADLIESAVLQPGDRLPPVRQLAADLGLAAGTVGRTYRELESAGLVSSRRGGGTRVSATVPALSAAERAQLLHTYAEAFVQRAALLGADQELILSAVARALRLGPAANAAVPR